MLFTVAHVLRRSSPLNFTCTRWLPAAPSGGPHVLVDVPLIMRTANRQWSTQSPKKLQAAGKTHLRVVHLLRRDISNCPLHLRKKHRTRKRSGDVRARWDGMGWCRAKTDQEYPLNVCALSECSLYISTSIYLCMCNLWGGRGGECTEETHSKSKS